MRCQGFEALRQELAVSALSSTRSMETRTTNHDHSLGWSDLTAPQEMKNKLQKNHQLVVNLANEWKPKNLQVFFNTNTGTPSRIDVTEA